MRWLAAVVWLSLSLSGVAAEDPAAEGLKALDAKNYGLAAQEFTKAVEADPKDYTALFNLALANTMLGKTAEAVEGYKKVLELQPGVYEAELNLGILLLGQKRAAEALPYLDAAAGQKPKEPRPHLYLSLALLSTGDLEKAGQSYQTTLELDPKSAPAELGLARALARQNRLADADPHFRHAAELSPSYRDSLLELADLYEKADRKAEAIALYREFPDDAAAREQLGLLLLESGQAADAIPHLEWAVKQSPTSANRLALAQAYRKSNEPEKAVPLLAAAVEAAPADLDLRMSYARELRDLRRFPDAAEQFARVAQAKPDWAQAWNELAGVDVMLENYPQALAALDHVRALKAEIPGDYFFRAMVLDRIHERKDAIAEYQKFLAVSKGEFPNQEFQARQRIRILELDLQKR
ncbi:MAG: tetratricopeptide repeat protein [Bryobacteraceae bacterium]|jgi:tetratricopeptide (TPR) repeat protein